MRDEVVVRRATVRDVDDILALAREVQALHAAARPDLFTPDGSESPAEVVARMERAHENGYWVATVGGHVAGYAYARWQDEPASPWKHATRTLTLDAMGVAASHQRRGIGERLWAAVREEARRQRVDRVILNVWAFNEAARTFYERMGFTPFHTRMAMEMRDRT
jgi:diamine N-acetyltransferase